jgi:hypothetical protein
MRGVLGDAPGEFPRSRHGFIVRHHARDQIARKGLRQGSIFNRCQRSMPYAARAACALARCAYGARTFRHSRCAPKVSRSPSGRGHEGQASSRGTSVSTRGARRTPAARRRCTLVGIGPRLQAAMMARMLDPAHIPGFEQRVAATLTVASAGA